MLKICIFLLNTLTISVCESDILSKFHQTDYHVNFHRVEVTNINKVYISQWRSTNFKYNRTTTALNYSLTPKIDMGRDQQVIFQAYKLLSNEYRVFPIRAQVKVCDAFDADVLGLQRAFKCGNFTQCELKKNVRYDVCNFVPDESKMPPFVPSGDYMCELTYVTDGKELGIVRMFAKIYRTLTK